MWKTDFCDLSQEYKTPFAVQRFLRTLPYNRELRGETLRSAFVTLQKKTAHCLEAALVTAAILEQRGFPPLVMSLESQDDLDHVVFVFRGTRGWGSVARSREEGLHGRNAVFPTIKDLALSYADPFVDKTGRLQSFALAHLDEVGCDWRKSRTDVWKVEDYLIQISHTPLLISDAQYKRAYDFFKRTGKSGIPQKTWW